MSSPERSAVSFDLSGRVAIVTGGSRGLGLAMSEAFAAAGACVVVASRKREACEAVAESLSERHGTRCLGVACHVGKWADCERLIATVEERFGRLDILVNNAGMSPLYETLEGVSEDLYDKVLAVNLKGPFRLSALAGSRMARGEGGAILNISSIAAVAPSANEVPYALAKAGLNTLTVALSRAFAPKVRVNCIMPGPFLTDISKAWDLETFARRAKETIPLQRGGEAHEIVGAALYLVSDAASYTTGAVLKIDGGSAFTPA
jgi:NAD(P)-dependent dehydrogenase (short-subunit alcohol dehydrogenase family)